MTSAWAEDEQPAQTEPPAEVAQPEAPAFNAEDASYAIGVKIAQSWVQRLAGDQLPYSSDQMVAGFHDGLTDAELRLDEQQIEQAMAALQSELMRLNQQRQAEASEKNLAEGQAFLEANAQREGVVTTDSGLQYEIIEAGEGDSPQMGDQVTVHYTGTLTDGTVFDSSVNPPQPGRPAQPATFQLGQVIPGWNEGLTHIAPGGKIKLYIPPDLAYGPTQRGPVIGPNATLVFEVELISVAPAPAQPEAQAEEDAAG